MEEKKWFYNPIIAVILIAAWVFGTFWGVGTLCYCHKYIYAAFVAVVGAMALPFVVGYVKKTMESL